MLAVASVLPVQLRSRVRLRQGSRRTFVVAVRDLKSCRQGRWEHVGPGTAAEASLDRCRGHWAHALRRSPELAAPAGAVVGRGQLAAKHRLRGVRHHHAKKGHTTRAKHGKHARTCGRSRRVGPARRLVVVSRFKPTPVRQTKATSHAKRPVSGAKRPAPGRYFRVRPHRLRAVRLASRGRLRVRAKSHKKKRKTSSGGLRHYAMLLGGGSIAALSLYLIFSAFSGGSRARAQARARSRLRQQALT